MNYFAYGSNLSHQQMLRRCPGSRPAGTGRLIGYRLAFAGNSDRWGGAVADIRPNSEWYVQGGIYRIGDTDLRLLDTYEGYPHFYTRDEIQLLLPSGETTIALTYMMADEHPVGKPSRSYLETIIQGFFDFGITPPPEVSAAEYIN